MEEVNLDLFEFPILPDPVFIAIFEQDTGKIIGVGPDIAFPEKQFFIEIEKELAEDILSGHIDIHDCFVDFFENTVEVKQVASLYKIDDVLHRIVEKRFTDLEDFEIYISYNKASSNLTIELTERFFGTRKLVSPDVRKQKMIWSGETELIFYLTEYNDPHVLHKIVPIKISDITEKSHSLTVKLPDKFSIFTRRLFKRYVMEII
jgi:hypothetical protein